jgi:putative component of membrane protein insertase Oxa1/YidC/SpoIIIJ protein YidD
MTLFLVKQIFIAFLSTHKASHSKVTESLNTDFVATCSLSAFPLFHKSPFVICLVIGIKRGETCNWVAWGEQAADLYSHHSSSFYPQPENSYK